MRVVEAEDGAFLLMEQSSPDPVNTSVSQVIPDDRVSTVTCTEFLHWLLDQYEARGVASASVTLPTLKDIEASFYTFRVRPAIPGGISEEFQTNAEAAWRQACQRFAA